MKLYLGNLPSDINDDRLREMVKEFGTPESAKVITDPHGASRGFGFVEFADSGQANAAIAALNGKTVSGKALVVNEARPQKNTGGGGGGRR